MKENKIFYILCFTIITVLISSCINESDYNNIPNDNNPEQKLYLFDTDNYQLKYIAESANFLLVPALNKLLFQWAGLWSYDILSEEIELIVDHNVGWFDDYNISPDSKYLIYGSLNKLYRINLLSYEEELLESFDGEIESDWEPRFSNDGKRIIFMTHPAWHPDLSNFDSLYANIYDFEQAKHITLDTVFIKDSYPYFAYFTDNSKKYFIGTVGRDSYSHIWKISLSVYANNTQPTFLIKLAFYPDLNSNIVWNGSGETIYIREDYHNLVQYDINSKNIISSTDISGYNYNFRKVKDSNELIGRNNNNNNIMVLNFISNNSVVYEPNIHDNISDYHYVPGYKYIALKTTEYK